MVLNAAGLGASAVYSGGAGVALARGLEFEFLVTGVIMPRMNGLEAAIQICQLLPKCKVLLVSRDNDSSALLQDAQSRVTNSNYSPSRYILLNSSDPFTQSKTDFPRPQQTNPVPALAFPALTVQTLSIPGNLFANRVLRASGGRCVHDAKVMYE